MLIAWDEEEPEATYATVYFGEHDGFDAAAVFFGLDCDDAIDLFSSENVADDDGSETPADVAARIREFVNSRATTAGT